MIENLDAELSRIESLELEEQIAALTKLVQALEDSLK